MAVVRHSREEMHHRECGTGGTGGPRVPQGPHGKKGNLTRKGVKRDGRFCPHPDSAARQAEDPSRSLKNDLLAGRGLPTLRADTVLARYSQRICCLATARESESVTFAMICGPTSLEPVPQHCYHSFESCLEAVPAMDRRAFLGLFRASSTICRTRCSRKRMGGGRGGS